MAFTEQNKADAYLSFVLLFNAAPGVVYGKEIVSAYESGATTADIVATLASKPAFKALFPEAQTPAQFAQAFIAQIAAPSVSQAVRLAAEADIQEALAAGWSQAQVITQIMTNLQGKSASDAAWGTTVALLKEKISIAQDLTEGPNASSATDWAALSAPLSKLTETPAPEQPTPSVPPTFAATLDGNNLLTFSNAGPDVTVTEAGAVYTFTNTGTAAGSQTVNGPIAGISVAAGTKLHMHSSLANGLDFPGAGTVTLTDTGSVDAVVLKTIEAKTTGLLDATSVSSITNANVADAHFLLVTQRGTSGNKIDTAADVDVTLTDTTATGNQLAAIDAATTGTINAASITSITNATVAQAMLLLVGNAAFTHAPDVAVSLNNGLMITQPDFNAISTATTGPVTSSFTGTEQQMVAILNDIEQQPIKPLATLTQIKLTDAITNNSLLLVDFLNDMTITLADVTGNSTFLTNGYSNSAHTITFDGTGVSTAIVVDASSKTMGKAVLKGGAGNDTFTASSGGILTGGAGDDSFIFDPNAWSTLANIATITDYRYSGVDTIYLGGTAEASNVNTVQNLSAQPSLLQAVSVMANASVIDNGLGVFIWGGDTYAFVETTGSNYTYVPSDNLIKLTGMPFSAGTSIVGLGFDGV